MAPVGGSALPWAERHRPRHLGQLVGNTDQVRKLAEWLRDWDDVVLKGKLKTPPENPDHAWMKFKPPPENINARAALVSGPPGIGKTSTCTLVVRCCRKYNLMEFNASDERSKNSIEIMSKSLAGNHTLRFGSTGGNIERSVIIMDECDGMAGGGDKGGMQALINMIKTTKSPIICICNDRSDQQVRNLASSCLDIKFRRPDNAMVSKRIKGILEGEGRKVDALALDAVVESCGHDIRQVLNQVQFFGSSSSSSKQTVLSCFDACSRLFVKETVASKKKLTTQSKFDLFYMDADMMPLMVQENYLRPFEKAGRISSEELAACAQASEYIAIADSMSGSFETMQSQAAIGTLLPAFLTASEAPVRASFPAWLQKRGPQNKATRLAQEMHARLKGFNTSCSSRALVTSSYHDVLHRRLIRPLASGDAKSCAKALNALGLNREFFTDQAPALRTPLGLEDGYRKVDGKVKTQLLYELQALQAQQAPQKKRLAPRNEDGEAAAKRGREGDDVAMDEDEAPGDTVEGDGDNGMFKSTVKKKAKVIGGIAKLRTPSAFGMSKASLSGWIPKKVQEAQDKAEGNDIKKPAGIILKFIEGHTNAVRRKVHLQDFMGPWRMF